MDFFMLHSRVFSESDNIIYVGGSSNKIHFNKSGVLYSIQLLLVVSTGNNRYFRAIWILLDL